MRGNKALAGALSEITAAVVGVILNLAVWFAIHTLFRDTFPVRALGLSFDVPVLGSMDHWAVLLAAGAAIAIFRFNANMIATLAGCALAGLTLHFLNVL